VLGHGGLRVRVPVGRLRADPQGGRATPSSEPVVQVRAAATGDAPSELDLRGRTAQEAREAVRAFVDEAALAGLQSVRVVHGRGTGAVRKAVRDELSAHPLVQGSESDSADGATVVQL
jgi:DNA mismatch repair protein MutS2